MNCQLHEFQDGDLSEFCAQESNSKGHFGIKGTRTDRSLIVQSAQSLSGPLTLTLLMSSQTEPLWEHQECATGATLRHEDWTEDSGLNS